MDFIHACRAFAARRLVAALPILLLGVPLGRAQTVSNFQQDKDHAPVISAWQGDSSDASRTTIQAQPSSPESRWRHAFWLRDPVDPWNQWQKSLRDDKDHSGVALDLGSKPNSVPINISDAVLELQPISPDD